VASGLTVLITCAGGVFALDTVQALRLDRELAVRVIGVDGNAAITECFYVDAYHSVPLASTQPEAFVQRLLDVCREESVDLVIPGADEEVFAIADAKERFEQAGIKVAVESRDKVELTRDKLRFLEHMKAAGVTLPPFAGLSQASDLPAVAEGLGYPGRRVILKPRVGRGARGLIVVDPTVNDMDHGTESRGYAIGDVAHVTELLASTEHPLGLVAMEFLPGDIWDVDCVAKDGIPLCIVPRRRLWNTPFSRGVEGHRIERNPEIEALMHKIAGALSYSYVFDCDFGTSADGKPGLLELNPRWSGSVAAALAGGVNVPAMLIRSMMDLPTPAVEVKPGGTARPRTRMVFEENKDFTVDAMLCSDT
jgi:carbamoyl-phosphate synthase large subunit